MNVPRTDRRKTDRGRMYATVAFGASLALAPIASAPGLSPELARGLQSAEGITGDIQNHLSGEISTLSDKVRADFFLKNVPFGSIIYNAARQHNVSPELVAAVARAESAFHP